MNVKCVCVWVSTEALGGCLPNIPVDSQTAETGRQ